MSEIVRVSPDGSRVLVQVSNDSYGVVASGNGRVQLFSTLADARQGQSWQRPTDGQRKLFASAPEVVDAALTELAISESVRSESRRVYRIPQSVREEAKRGLRWAQLHGASAELLSIGDQLAKSESIGVNDVQRITETRLEQTIDTLSSGYRRDDAGYPSRSRVDHALMGGQAGEAWLNKLARVHKLSIIASAFSYDSDAVYMAGGQDPESTQVTHLYRTLGDDSWQEYVDGAWEDKGEMEPDDPQLIELNEESATALAGWLDAASERTEADQPYFELQDINPIERNLFDLAAPHIDWVEIDRASALAATDGIYTPQERSSNAQRQQRSSGGRFGGGAAGDTAPASSPSPEQTAPATPARARLMQPLPLVDDINALIQGYLDKLGAHEMPASGVPTPEQTSAAIAEAPQGVTQAAPLYLAIVDPVDTQAVLDLIALLPADATNTDVTALRRAGGQWVNASDVLTDLRGDTPPPVVQLPDDATVEAVLTQVDASDPGGDNAVSGETAPATPATSTPAPVAASGWGGLFGEFGEIIPIYGPRGDVERAAFVAAGVPGIEDTPTDKAATDRLRRYWAHGEGAAKIRWGTPGDLTRCHREINKYMSSERAWGFCQLRHREATGEWNKD